MFQNWSILHESTFEDGEDGVGKAPNYSHFRKENVGILLMPRTRLAKSARNYMLSFSLQGAALGTILWAETKKKEWRALFAT